MVNTHQKNLDSRPATAVTEALGQSEPFFSVSGTAFPGGTGKSTGSADRRAWNRQGIGCPEAALSVRSMAGPDGGAELCRPVAVAD